MALSPVEAAAQLAASVLKEPLEYDVVHGAAARQEPSTRAEEAGLLAAGSKVRGFPGRGWLKLSDDELVGKWVLVGSRLEPLCLRVELRGREAEGLLVCWPGLAIPTVAYCVEWRLPGSDSGGHVMSKVPEAHLPPPPQGVECLEVRVVARLLVPGGDSLQVVGAFSKVALAPDEVPDEAPELVGEQEDAVGGEAADAVVGDAEDPEKEEDWDDLRGCSSELAAALQQRRNTIDRLLGADSPERKQASSRKEDSSDEVSSITPEDPPPRADEGKASECEVAEEDEGQTPHEPGCQEFPERPSGSSSSAAPAVPESQGNETPRKASSKVECSEYQELEQTAKAQEDVPASVQPGVQPPSPATSGTSAGIRGSDPAVELEEVRRQKQLAVEAEDFKEAARLKSLEKELLAKLHGGPAPSPASKQESATVAQAATEREAASIGHRAQADQARPDPPRPAHTAEAGVTGSSSSRRSPWAPGGAKAQSLGYPPGGSSSSSAPASPAPAASGQGGRTLASRLGSTEAAERLLKKWGALDCMGEAELLRECKKRGLLPNPGFKVSELVAQLKEAQLWEDLPVRELVLECEAKGLSVADAPKVSEKDRQDLLQRLLVTLCSRVYECKGVPARRLGSVMAAAKVAAQFDRLEALELNDLQQECERLAIPLDGAQSAGLLKDRARRVLIWRELPISELRSECKSLSISTDGEEQRRELVRRLIASVWQSSSPPNAQGNKAQPQASQQRNRGSMTKFFQDLELPHTATSNDVKRAYRRLALKYHPDKNAGSADQEEMMQRFRTVTAAYDALSDFLSR